VQPGEGRNFGGLDFDEVDLSGARDSSKLGMCLGVTGRRAGVLVSNNLDAGNVP